MMRSGYRRTVRAGVAVLGAVVLGLATTACGDDGDADAGETGGERQSPSPTPPGEPKHSPEPEEPAEDDADAGDEDADGGEQVRPYVINFYGEENAGGNPDQEPANLVLTEHTSLASLDWEQWDGEQAVGSGLLAGMWCLPECLDDPFEATVTLSGPEEINGELYYTAFEVESPAAEKFQADDLDGERPLAVPNG